MVVTGFFAQWGFCRSIQSFGRGGVEWGVYSQNIWKINALISQETNEPYPEQRAIVVCSSSLMKAKVKVRVYSLRSNIYTIFNHHLPLHTTSSLISPLRIQLIRRARM